MITALDSFCSGEEEEDLDIDMHSPTDTSEDSVDVKVKPIASLIGSNKNKRKCIEPKRVDDSVKRKFDFHSDAESEINPFRPWSHVTPPSGYIPKGCPKPSNGQDEPLSLVLRETEVLQRLSPAVNSMVHGKSRSRPQEVVRIQDSIVETLPVQQGNYSEQFVGRVQEIDSDKSRVFSVEALISERAETSLSTSSSSIIGEKKKSTTQSQQRNYKNMTRERRIEANARERTRVHTISAAFDTLRRAVPAYSHNQKLSKLSVLRIACSYILTLSRVAGADYSADASRPSLADCVDNVSRTIQLEGKLRRKKDD